MQPLVSGFLVETEVKSITLRLFSLTLGHQCSVITLLEVNNHVFFSVEVFEQARIDLNSP